MQGSKTLTRRQEQALIELISGGSSALSEIARKISVNPSTLWRWLNQDEAFKRRYRELRAAQVERAIAEMQSLTGEAVTTLKRNLSSGHSPSEVRTAVSIIRQSLEAIDLMDLESRVSELEKELSHEHKK